MEIEIKDLEGIRYYEMCHRAISYTLRHIDNEWELQSHRQALGWQNPGSYRFFKSLEDLEKSVKAFKGISMLINSEVMV